MPVKLAAEKARKERGQGRRLAATSASVAAAWAKPASAGRGGLGDVSRKNRINT